MFCKCCGKPLRDAISWGEYKSCPNCSRMQGEHVFYRRDDFGYTEKRETENNPEGIQSWCARCRATHGNAQPCGIKCHEMNV